jgi:hypothetical protein
VSCLYCGKVIGAFRLLRDSEFCCEPHRQKYGNRLGKALHVMLAPESAPAGVADFLDQMPYQQGNCASTLIPWHVVEARRRIRTGSHWPLSIDTIHATGSAVALAECAPIDSGQCGENWIPDAVPTPALRIPRFAAELEPTSDANGVPHALARCDNWMPVTAPEGVAAFVPAIAAPAPAKASRVPLAAELVPPTDLDRTAHAPTPCDKRIPGPTPEPVAAFVHASTALSLAETPYMVRYAAELEPTPFLDMARSTLPACHNWVPIPAAEPVAAFVQASASPTALYGPRILRFSGQLEAAPPPEFALAACQLQIPGFATADAGQAPANAPEPAYAPVVERPAAPRMPAPEFVADLEPLPMFEVPLHPPAMCARWMPAPAAEPVFSYVRTSTAPALAVLPAMKAPAFAMAAAAAPVARMDLAEAMPRAEEPVAGVGPNVATAPLGWMHPAAAMALPAVPSAAQELLAAAGAAATALPEAVEGVPPGAQASQPVSMTHVPQGKTQLGAPRVFLEPVPAMGKAMPLPAPAVQQSVPVVSVAGRMAVATRPQMLPFLQEASQRHALPSLNAQHMTQEVQKPAAAGPRLVTPQPLATLMVTPPEMGPRQVESGLPRPGLVPVEYYSQRLRNIPVCRVEWRTLRPTLMPPPFALDAILEKLEEPVPVPRPTRPGFGKLRTMPAAKLPPSVLMVAGRVAAAFLLATSLWVGVAHFRGNRQLIAQGEVPTGEVLLSPGRRAGGARVAGGETATRAASKGPVAWVRRTIAHRAALKIADDFRGMENWDGEANARPAGWTRNPDGYVNTGALALFHPSRKFTDCRLEFFGQIEAKSIGWTVHAADAVNYHAMKLTVVEAGMRPFVALVHYNVVGGKPGHRTQTPLNIMVHNNQPMQFSVDVHGSRVVTSIDGEEVDSFIDNTLVAGGVGFFSDVGERARLYWMRVSRNDDWLGHVCAMLADGAAEGRTARLRGPSLPGAPAPGLPGDGDTTVLAGMWIALPTLRATRKARLLRTWRSEPWSTQAEAEATWTACPCRRA